MPDPVSRLNAALEGRYRIERQLGEGGMATVYLADDLKHERKVALKVLKPDLAAVVGAERFLAEIKTTANLQHPHILPLFDSGEADGFLFYVMPYVEGETLRERLDRERQLPVDEALGIATAVANALQAAHERGVIHRDIKPGNILLSRGQPLVADFGIALAVSAGGRGRLTETGLSLGTPYYMSPEQATGDQAVGPASDTFALACVLYEMLVGEPPYPGTTAQAVLGKIIQGAPVSATAVRPSVPANVDAAIRKALEKLPADRFTGAQDFARALADRGFRHGAAHATATTAGARGRASGPRIAMATAAVLLTGVGGFLAGRATSPEPLARVARFTAPAAEGLTAVAACCGPAQTVSPDGEWLVYMGLGPEGQMLYRRRLGELADEPIAGTEGASSPFFSPDGLFVGFHADGRIRKIPLEGGASVSITEVDRIDGGSWGDNDVIVFTTASEAGANLWTVPAAGGEARPVPIDSNIRRMYPWMLPGGTAALARIGTALNSPVVAVDLETGKEDTLGVASRVAYASGYLVTYADGTLLAQPFDPERRRATGASVAILDGVGSSGPGVGNYALSREGTLVYVTGSSAFEISLVIEGPGGTEVAVTSSEELIAAPAFSPDGRRVAFNMGRASEPGNIWVWDRDQQTRQLLVEGRAPAWTPDGARVAFRTVDEPSDLHWIPADGSGVAEPLLVRDFSLLGGAWSPDGRELAFVARPAANAADIGVLDVGTDEVRWLAAEDAREDDPKVSPDGRWLAYSSNRSGNDEVYVRALDGSGGVTQVSAAGGVRPRWTASGDALLYQPAVAVAIQRYPLVRAALAFEERARVIRREDGPVVGAASWSGWDLGPAGETVFVTTVGGDDGGMRPTFVWVLNWPEIVRGLSGGG